MGSYDKEVNSIHPLNGSSPPERMGSVSDALVFDRPNLPPAALSPMPTVTSLNAYKSKVHVGTKIELHDGEIVKGRFFGLDLVQVKNSRRLRCSIAVFVCWTLVVAIALTIYLVRMAINWQSRLDLGIKENWYFRREDWQAMKPYEVNYLTLPVKFVIVGHSATPYCKERFDCTEKILAIQMDHLQRDFDDISPNFLIAGKGLVFEGRGANVLGAMVANWNSKIISIMFLGDYSIDHPDTLQCAHLNVLLDYLLKHNVLEKDYILYGRCQINTLTISPGQNIMQSMKNFSHWDQMNKDLCLNG